ncbi:MAG: hypothetical protein ACRDLU_01450 [Gaiellaceae bacterium]
MDIEIRPEPSPEERAAIEAAVAGLLAGTGENHSAWWHAGLLDAVELDESDPPARTSPAL